MTKTNKLKFDPSRHQIALLPGSNESGKIIEHKVYNRKRVLMAIVLGEIFEVSELGETLDTLWETYGRENVRTFYGWKLQEITERVKY